MNKFLVSMTLLLGWCASTGAYAGLKQAKEAYEQKNYREMLDNLHPLVRKGNPEAMFYVGLLYDNGEGVKQNYNIAKDWYLRAAKLGYAPAQNNLGWILQMGTSTALSDKDAADWYLKAAQQNYAPAQFNLGLLYFAGRGGNPKDPREATAWFSKAAEQGYTPAQNSLAKMYLYGQGVLVSLVQAYKWFYVADSLGDAEAKKNLSDTKRLLAPDMIAESTALAKEWLAKHSKTASLQ